jgi:hypothetical protein
VPNEKQTRRVTVEIPGVTADTPVGDLKVGQLIDLLVQVHTQLPIQRGMPPPEVISEAIAEVHRQIASPDAAFRQVQAAILKEVPNVMREGPWARKDGGPSPHARGTVTGTRVQDGSP